MFAPAGIRKSRKDKEDGARREAFSLARSSAIGRMNRSGPMGKSRKREPIVGMSTAPSDKPFKRAEHQRERAAVRAALASGREMPSARSFGDSAQSLKDGKQYLPEDAAILRK